MNDNEKILCQNCRCHQRNEFGVNECVKSRFTGFDPVDGHEMYKTLYYDCYEKNKNLNCDEFEFKPIEPKPSPSKMCVQLLISLVLGTILTLSFFLLIGIKP